jgi:methylmalonyl-CoA mutase
MAKKTKRPRRLGKGRLDLAGGFPAASDEAWRRLVKRILGDRDIDEVLTRKTYDGIAIHPLYTAEDWRPDEDASGFPGMPPYTRGHRVVGQSAGGWDIGQRHAHPEPSACNQAILDDVERGVTSIELRLDRAGRKGRDSDDPAAVADIAVDGIAISSIEDLDTVLEGVFLDACPIGLRAGAAYLPTAAMLIGLLSRRGIAGKAFAGAFNADPLGALAELGELPTSGADALELMAALARHVAEAFPAATTVAVDATVYHEAGASEAQELACAVATGAAYLRALTAAGLDLATAFRQIALTFATDANLFLSIAKLRAARRLWGRVAEACGTPQATRSMRLQAVTSERMMLRRDPWVNILRGTVAALSASVAGADSIIVLPFTTAIGLPDRAARRIARNTQLVLQQESSLSRVIDPAGGSWAIESLTDAMAQEAWTLFQGIEAEGGMLAAIESGRIQERIAAVAARRAQQVAELGNPLIGTSAFPDLSEQPVGIETVDVPALRSQTAVRLDRHRAGIARTPAAVRLAALAGAAARVRCEAILEGAAAGATLNALYRATSGAKPATAVPLRRVRLGQDFDALRGASDAYLERTGKRPIVFLAAIGSPAQYMTAAAYARNFLAAGGIAAAGDGEDTDGTAAVRAFRSSGARIAVLCSDEAGYRGAGAGLASALTEAGAQLVYMVGRPPGDAGSAAADGVKGFLYEGCDVLAILKAMHRVMGISER